MELATRNRPPISEETRQKIKAQLAKPEIRHIMSAKAQARSWGKSNPFYGKHHSQETKEKLSRLNKLGLIGRKGQKNTPIHNARISASNKIAYSAPELKEECRQRSLSIWEHPQKRLEMITSMKGKKKPKQAVEKHAKFMENYWEMHTHPCLGKKWTEEERLRSSLAHIGVQAGDKSPRWLGGISFEPYGVEFNNTLKGYIRARDGYACQLCGVPECECYRRLNIHHIDYNKKRNDFSNLITLCHSCNARVNINRDFWQGFFNQMMLLKQHKQLTNGTQIWVS